MAKLKPLETWRNDTFDEPRPTLRACQKWAKQGHIIGARKVGYLWFVDPEKYNAATGNPLIDRVMAN